MFLFIFLERKVPGYIRQSYWKYMGLASYNPMQNILRFEKNTKKLSYLFLRIFWTQLPKICFYKGDWAQGCVPMQFWAFPNVSLFPKILSLKLFGNLWGNQARPTSSFCAGHTCLSEVSSSIFILCSKFSFFDYNIFALSCGNAKIIWLS